ncbi:MAG TPA: 30S ribosomal protein S20 [Proteobacteria bacterium]|nr:30S ribosomal protein S20 [bacterium BMS3Abin14]HDL54147.1 30S ribosomal protein S20 [Pseudomonadota bacterium]
MATHKSAIKRHKQSLKRRLSNQMRRTRIKTLTKELIIAVDAGDRATAEKTLKEAVPVIQKAASAGTIHRNSAGRKVSRLTRKFNSLPSGQ